MVIGDMSSPNCDVNIYKENVCFLAILNWKVTKNTIFLQKHIDL